MEPRCHLHLALSISCSLALVGAGPRPAASPPAPAVLSDVKNPTAELTPQGLLINGSVLVPNRCWSGAIRPAASPTEAPPAFEVVRTYTPPAKSTTCGDVSAYVYVPSLTVKAPHPPKTITLVTSNGDRTVSVTTQPPASG